ncbi:uncharacterized protein LOC126687514 [Mercurialis annua]|uniref:uncharacterized protein LOC126687514 n=1 Tax=Mercurialis annua TaxID=3986 RepID=UPI0021605667|nr:uncharacterized protein LOC126687514 [Mercurialis annua]
MDTIDVAGSNSTAFDANKPFHFEGLHFKRWRQKIEFFLTMKKVVSVLTMDMPIVDEFSLDEEKEKQNADLQQWMTNNYLCKNFILNALNDDLYDYYNNDKTTKEIWEALQKKYDTEETVIKKYVVSHYLKYQMTDDKSVEAQSYELQKIAHEIISEGMVLDEQFQVVVLIDKLPLLWKDFKNSLRHKTKEFLLESLITRLRIEEEARKQDQRDEVLVVSNNTRKFDPANLKPNGKKIKNQNRNSNSNQNVNCNKNQNGNPPRNHNVRQQPPVRNDLP